MGGEVINTSDDSNARSEWAAMKEYFDNEYRTFDFNEQSEDGKNDWRERNGQRLVEAIRNLPDRPSDTEMEKSVEKVRRIMKKLGATAMLKNIEATREDAFFSEKDSLDDVDGTMVEKVRDRVVRLEDLKDGGLKDEFASGTYLFHGAKVDGIREIFESGFLGNMVAVNGKRGANSGYEGVSWSVNGIDALPGTKGHIAGFLAAPENILEGDEKLAIPARPAPYELLQVNGVNKDFYDDRIQDELFGAVSLGELNSARSNFVMASMWSDEKNRKMMSEPLIYQALRNEKITTERLQSLYEIRDGVTHLSNELVQQYEVPVGMVWTQRLIDGGAFKGTEYDGMSVKEIIEKCKEDKDLIINLNTSTKAVRELYDEKVDAELSKAQPVKNRIEDMYFVTNEKDLDIWTKIIAMSGHIPKGILLYDGDKVSRPNFASKYLGNHDELMREIDAAVQPDQSLWKERIGLDVENIERAGAVGQVLKETEISHDKVGKMVDGKFMIVEDE